MYSCDRQQYAACTALGCVENITCTKRRLFVSAQARYVSYSEFPFPPCKKRRVTQLSKPDDHIEKPHNLALICLKADHFPLNSTLYSIVGVAGPSWLRA